MDAVPVQNTPSWPIAKRSRPFLNPTPFVLCQHITVAEREEKIRHPYEI